MAQVFLLLVLLGIVLLVALLVGYMLFRADSREPFADATLIPKRIWTFWNDSEQGVPDLVRKCIAGWHKYGGDGTTVVLLTPANLAKYVSAPLPDTFDSLSNPMKADWVRCAVLAEHGGVWMDASTILTRSLDDTFFNGEAAEYVGFYLRGFTLEKFEKTSPVIESWMMACPAQSVLMRRLFEEFDYACKKYGPNGQGYLDELAESRLETLSGSRVSYDDVVQNNTQLPYLLIHVVIQVVLQTAPEELRKSWRIRVWPAEETALSMQVHNGWDIAALAKDLVCTNMQDLPYEPPGIIKLRGNDRAAVLEAIASGCVAEGSVYAKYLGR